MTKKIFILLVTVVCSLMLVACGTNSDSKKEIKVPNREPISESELQQPPVQQK